MAKKPECHDLDYSLIDEVDEVDSDEQLVLVWCNTHQTWERHWIPRPGYD